jgi:hypothetical protein
VKRGVDFEDHAWFAGFAPAEKPEIVVVALIENAGHGGEVAAPVVRKVMMQYFGVSEPLVRARGHGTLCTGSAASSARVSEYPNHSGEASHVTE